MKTILRKVAPFAFVAAAGFIAACNTSTQPNDAITTSPSVILEQDSTNYPNACQLDSATLRTELGLTDAQVAQIVAVRDSLRAAEIVELTAANGDRETIHAILDKYRAALRSAIEGILTPDQLTKLQGLLAARGDGERNRMGGHRGVRGGCFMRRDSVILDSATLAKLKTDLTLTDTQIVAIQTLADSLNADTTVTDKGHVFIGDLKSILTSDQWATLQQLARSREPWEREEGDDRHHGGRHGHH